LSAPGNKKADAIVAPKGFHRVGLLFNEPSSIGWLLFVLSSDFYSVVVIHTTTSYII